MNHNRIDPNGRAYNPYNQPTQQNATDRRAAAQQAAQQRPVSATDRRAQAQAEALSGKGRGTTVLVERTYALTPQRRQNLGIAPSNSETVAPLPQSCMGAVPFKPGDIIVAPANATDGPPTVIRMEERRENSSPLPATRKPATRRQGE